MNPAATIVYQNILNRRSIRNFKAVEIAPEQLDILMKAGDAAPSAGNLKSREIKLLTSREEVDFVISYIYSARVQQHFATFKNAAALVLLLANIRRCRTKYKRGRLYAMQDATLAGENILLMATALGIGSCWVGQVKESQILRRFDIGEDYKLVGIIALGYGAET
jgi:nitroreductase